MERIERYLDDVCGPLGGCRERRQQVREELRSHLQDAIARHRAGGMSQQDAIGAAIRELGEPEQVRGELESVHGHRLLGATADRAAQKTRRWFDAGKWPVVAAGIAAFVLLLDGGAVWFGMTQSLPEIVQQLRAADAQIPGHFILVLQARNVVHGGVGILLVGALALLLAAWLIAERQGPSMLRALMRGSLIVMTSMLTLAVLYATASTAYVVRGLPRLGN